MPKVWGVPEITGPQGWRLRAHYVGNALA